MPLLVYWCLQMLTFLLRLTGSGTSKVEVSFAPAEMRSPIEVKAQLNLMAAVCFMI